ncbi:hypothetical protein PybrP1_001137 [[Pythium] brassicae (nom. inval.)]|nr:hypothetical protein PybrP1_001137 [[Pythium] brassicae (nom. inval.)]
MQRLLGWAARGTGTGDGASRGSESAAPDAGSSTTPDDSAASDVTSAVAADTRGDYALAVELYAAAIEKLLLELRQLETEPERVQMRRKIHEYMTRAEYLKEQLRRRTPTPPGAAPSRSTQGTSHSRFIAQHAQHAHAILDEVLDRSPQVKWDDIAGLRVAKQILQEAVIYPSLRPDLFRGLLAPPRGVLLFGPPGTGKTLLAKAVATESNATFFNISASSLTSKWVGEGEKLVRVLFEIARELQPSVIFLDEMDALLSTRSASENDASRRIKNQFFTELDGAASSPDDRILVMGATNLPQELDEAIIRRLEKRIFVPLPDDDSRGVLLRHLLSSQKSEISARDMAAIVKATAGYSGSDLKALCKDAAMGPIRELGARITQVKSEDVRGVSAQDFKTAITRVRPSVSNATVEALLAWNALYGVSAAGS